MPFLSDPDCPAPHSEHDDHDAPAMPAPTHEDDREPEHEDDHDAPTEPDGQPGPEDEDEGDDENDPQQTPPNGKLPSADEPAPGTPQVPTHPRDVSEEALVSSFLHQLRGVKETAIALTALHDGATYSHVVKETKTSIEGLLGRLEGAQSPNGAGA